MGVSNKEIIKPENLEHEAAENVQSVETSDSDVSMSDSSDSDAEIDTPGDNNVRVRGPSIMNRSNQDSDDSEPEETEEEVEDEVIKAIRRQQDAKSDHPQTIRIEEFIADICFHPHNDIIAVGDYVGDIVLYQYSNDENKVISNLEMHTKACRDIEFSLDGEIILSTSKDKSIMLSNVETGKLIRFYGNSHAVPVSCLRVIDENMFCTGDDDGMIKLWDLRQQNDEPIYKTKKNEEFISDMVTNEDQKYLLCSSGDGSITTIDLQNRKVHMQSEEYDEELNCLGLFRNETKVVAGSSKGKLYIYNWNEFGLHSDIFPGIKRAINAMIPVTENIVVAAYEDGNIKATHLLPNRHLGIVGQHEMSVERLDISHDGQLIASSSHNNDIKFWNISYFEDFEKVSHKHNKHEKKKEMQHNLPSSQVKNVSDFFSDLA